MIDDSTIDEITPGALALYLQSRGWVQHLERKRFTVWSAPGADLRLAAPSSQNLDDFHDRVYEALFRLSEFERVAPDIVAANVRYAETDRLRFRLVGPSVGPGEIRLNDGRALFEGVRDLVVAAASAAFSPRPTFAPRRPVQVDSYLAEVRFGTTEAGSYIVNVISPIEPFPERDEPGAEAEVVDPQFDIDDVGASEDDEDPNGGDHQPFGRRVAEHVIDGVKAALSVSASINRLDDPDAVLRNAIQLGVSAPLCEALGEMMAEAPNASVAVSVDWGPAFPARPDAGGEVVVDSGLLAGLATLAERLRVVQPSPGVEVRGLIKNLVRGEKDEVGRVTIQTHIDGRRRMVNVELPEPEYARAAHSHAERLEVSIRGTIARLRNRSYLLDPSPIEVIGPPVSVRDEAPIQTLLAVDAVADPKRLGPG